MAGDNPTPPPGQPPPGEPRPEWTLEEASAYFAEGGVPIEATRLRMIIRGLQWKPTGERRLEGAAGRGKPTYDVAALMRLHSAIAPWIAVQGPLSGRDPTTGSPT